MPRSRAGRWLHSRCGSGSPRWRSRRSDRDLGQRSVEAERSECRGVRVRRGGHVESHRCRPDDDVERCGIGLIELTGAEPALDCDVAVGHRRGVRADRRSQRAGHPEGSGGQHEPPVVVGAGGRAVDADDEFGGRGEIEVAGNRHGRSRSEPRSCRWQERTVRSCALDVEGALVDLQHAASVSRRGRLAEQFDIEVGAERGRPGRGLISGTARNSEPSPVTEVSSARTTVGIDSESSSPSVSVCADVTSSPSMTRSPPIVSLLFDTQLGSAASEHSNEPPKASTPLGSMTEPAPSSNVVSPPSEATCRRPPSVSAPTR